MVAERFCRRELQDSTMFEEKVGEDEYPRWSEGLRKEFRPSGVQIVVCDWENVFVLKMETALLEHRRFEDHAQRESYLSTSLIPAGRAWPCHTALVLAGSVRVAACERPSNREEAERPKIMLFDEDSRLPPHEAKVRCPHCLLKR